MPKCKARCGISPRCSKQVRGFPEEILGLLDHWQLLRCLPGPLKQHEQDTAFPKHTRLGIGVSSGLSLPEGKAIETLIKNFSGTSLVVYKTTLPM